MNPGDHICILCYDLLKVAHSFKEKACEAFKKRKAVQLETSKKSPELPLPKVEIIIEREDIVEAAQEVSQEEIYVEKLDEVQTEEIVEAASSEPKKKPRKKLTTESGEQTPFVEYPIVTNADGINVYKCPFVFCDKTCKLKPALTSHIRSHTKEKPFQCTECDKSFSENGNLKQHIRSIHRNDRPFKCENCSRGFKTHYSHRVHIRSCFTKEKPYECDMCSSSFISSGKLLLHKRRHLGEKPYQCSECPYAFIDKASMKRHFVRRHASAVES